MGLLDTADTSDHAGPTHALLSAKELVYCQVCGQRMRQGHRPSLWHRRAQEYFVAYASHMRENVLEQLPDGFQDLTQQSETGTAKDTFPQPQLDRHIFCRVLEDRGTVDLGNDGCAAVPAASAHAHGRR